MLAETLEPRRFLSLSLSQGILVVNGTSRPDHITFSIDYDASPPALILLLNGRAKRFPATDIKGIQVHAGNGNDFVHAPDERRSTIDGNNGDDTLVGANQRDILRGGNGNDLLQGGDRNDTLLGGNGNDTLDAQAGNDLLHGNDGNDLLTGGAGYDRLYGDNGNDSLDLADGHINGKLEFAYGGPGDDSAHLDRLWAILAWITDPAHQVESLTYRTGYLL